MKVLACIFLVCLLLLPCAVHAGLNEFTQQYGEIEYGLGITPISVNEPYGRSYFVAFTTTPNNQFDTRFQLGVLHQNTYGIDDTNYFSVSEIYSTQNGSWFVGAGIARLTHYYYPLEYPYQAQFTVGYHFSRCTLMLQRLTNGGSESGGTGVNMLEIGVDF